MGGRGRVLDQRAGAQPARAQAQQDGGAGDHRPARAALGLQVDQRRAGRAGRGADGGALQRPGGEQQPDAVRRQEQPARARAGRQGHGDDAAAAQVVRQRPEHQQGDQQGQDVDGEDGGQRRRREPPLGLVDADTAATGPPTRRAAGTTPRPPARTRPPAAAPPAWHVPRPPAETGSRPGSASLPARSHLRVGFTSSPVLRSPETVIGCCAGEKCVVAELGHDSSVPAVRYEGYPPPDCTLPCPRYAHPSGSGRIARDAAEHPVYAVSLWRGYRRWPARLRPWVFSP